MLDENLDEILLGVALINNGLTEAPVLESETTSWLFKPLLQAITFSARTGGFKMAFRRAS